MAQLATHTQLYRSRDSYVAGVCAGIAERLDFDPIVVRILAILLTIVTFGLAAIVYIALWAKLPLEPEPSAPYDVTPQQAASTTIGEVDFIDVTNFGLSKSGDSTGIPIVPRLVTAVVLMLLFLVVAMNVAPMVAGTHWWQFWPLALLITGLFLIVVPVLNRYEAAWHSLGIAVTSVSAMMLPMSLEVVSWDTIPYAFEHLWVLVIVAAVLFAFGFMRDSGPLMVAGALLFAIFCLVTLFAYAVPGDINALFVHMPDGRSLRIALG